MCVCVCVCVCYAYMCVHMCSVCACVCVYVLSRVRMQQMLDVIICNQEWCGVYNFFVETEQCVPKENFLHLMSLLNGQYIF